MLWKVHKFLIIYQTRVCQGKHISNAKTKSAAIDEFNRYFPYRTILNVIDMDIEEKPVEENTGIEK